MSLSAESVASATDAAQPQSEDRRLWHTAAGRAAATCFYNPATRFGSSGGVSFSPW